ncbi:biotin/lipoyl-binding carrier protein [Paraburkholderia phymatum]|jgi:biotin carboxyl carrier protein|uniref:biotin/lipoyl-binding carrier protein n=1 Tax=Paraburkholderia phymatum TaxID=148447 RepID=UPI0031807844
MPKLEMKAEVTGAVWKVLKVQGDAIDEGDTVLIFESMKMEIPLIAEDAGRIVEIRVAEGQPVSEGDTVVVLELE